MTPNLPPIVKTAERLLLEVEQAVRAFPRFHKYELGSDLRKLAMKIATLAHRAWRETAMRETLLSHLARAIDGIKLSLQLGSRLRAFSSFGQFEALSRTAVELGRQVGGWQRTRSNHPKGQNAAGSALPQRLQKLSPRAASHREANP